jgi:hypothetical protein
LLQVGAAASAFSIRSAFRAGTEGLAASHLSDRIGSIQKPWSMSFIGKIDQLLRDMLSAAHAGDES